MDSIFMSSFFSHYPRSRGTSKLRMIRRKYLFLENIRPGTVLCLILPFLPQLAISYTLLFRAEMNCSEICTCHHNALINSMKQYNVKHFTLMGEKYRPGISYFDEKSDYMTFLGMFAPILHRIADINCALSDGKSHSILSLLNGIDELMDTALNVKCLKGENLIWDVPSWHTSFNIFASENCNIVPRDTQKSIIIPMNMWILDVENGGRNILTLMDIKFTMNTLTLSINGSLVSTIPKHWHDIYLVSASVISLRNTGIEEFDCPFRFTKILDTLNLEGNRLAHFPDCLLHSYNIRLNYLSLESNGISDLTPLYEVPEMSGMSDISVINLSFNQIRSIEAIRNMCNLVVLDLSHNAIRDITEDAFEHLFSLKELYLGHNNIHAVGLRQFTNNLRLSNIDLSHNILTMVLPEQFPPESPSIILDVRQNMLIYPPFRDCAKNKLKNFNFKIYSAGNPFFCDCHMLEFENCQKWVGRNTANYTREKNMYKDVGHMICTAPEENNGVSLMDISFHSKCIVIDGCPVSCSCSLLNTESLVVNCSARRLLEMPDSLPSYSNASTVLYLDHNPLQMLSHRPYLRVLSELHADNCLLTSITPAAMSSLQDIRVLTLHNNLLQKLPSSTRNITLNHARNVTLHNNRWACTCDSLWLPRWITKHKSSLWMPGSIACHYLRKPVEELTELDLNCNSSSYIDTFLAISLTLSSLVSTLVIMICYRSEISVLLYSKLGFRLDYGFSCGDIFSPYDAFVSYSQDSNNWVVDAFVPSLENGPVKYRLCLHYRDFPTEESLGDNLPWSVRRSRCAILVLSKDIMKKEWRIMEVRATFHRLLLVANKFIIIVIDDINIDELPADLRSYMTNHEYLRVEDPSFWSKLVMYLPSKQQTLGTDQATSVIGAGDSDPQHTVERNEETGVSDLSELSFRLTEIGDHEL